MSIVRHRADIEGYYKPAIEALHAGLVVIGENAGEPAPGATWVRMSFTVLSGFRQGVGHPQETYNGLFNIQVFAQPKTGAAQASDIIDDSLTVLRAASLTGIEFLDFAIPTGQMENGWYTLLLRATFRAFD